MAMEGIRYEDQDKYRRSNPEDLVSETQMGKHDALTAEEFATLDSDSGFKKRVERQIEAVADGDEGVIAQIRIDFPQYEVWEVQAYAKAMQGEQTRH